MTRLMALAIGALVLAQAEAQAQVQVWPTRPVKVILPFGAGSGLDISARLFAERLGPKWGQPIIVENRPGADGLLAIGAFVSAADDHVLLLASSANFAAHPYQHEKLPYQRSRDLEPIARVTDTVVAVAVPAASGVGSLKEFVARAHAAPGKLNTSGSAGLAEFALMGFIKSEKLDVARISYRDAVQPSLDLSEGRLDLLVGGLVVIRPHAEAGKVRVLAVTGSGRTVLAPGVPSVAEAGYPVLGIETTVGYFGPRGMPLALRERIGADIVAAAADATLVARHAATGQMMRPGGPAELAKALDDQDVRTAEIARVLDMKKKVAP